jgi:putative SOS response-associated peptidase YedK
MCGRYASRLPPEYIRGVFRTVGDVPNFAANYNLSPSQDGMVVRRHPETGERRLDVLKWGLIPYHEKDPKGGRKPPIARAETVATSGLFRDAFVRRRCLVPADAFYEWKPVAAGKQPYAIARQDGEVMAFAGLSERWHAPDGEIVRTFAIITTAANAEMAELHDRMPVILEPADWPVWLGEVDGDLGALLRPAPDHTLRIWPVSPQVNNWRNNGPDLLAPITTPAR